MYIVQAIPSLHALQITAAVGVEVVEIGLLITPVYMYKSKPKALLAL